MTLKELIRASEANQGLIEIYEQNIWTALNRLEENAIDGNGANFINTTLTAGFTLGTRQFGALNNIQANKMLMNHVQETSFASSYLKRPIKKYNSSSSDPKALKK
jgi:hypothetical protein